MDNLEYLRASYVDTPTHNGKQTPILPPDILLAVLDYLASPTVATKNPRLHLAPPRDRAHHAATAVCRAWNPIATEVLYRDIRVSSFHSLSALLKSVEDAPELRPLIRSCVLQSSFFQDRRALAALSRLEACCPNMLRLGFGFHYQYIPSALGSGPLLAKLTSLHVCSRLTSCGTYLSVFTWLSHTVTLPALEELTLEGISLEARTRWPKSPRLRTLRLYDCTISGIQNALFFDQFPHIVELEMVHLTIEADMKLLERLLRPLSATLETLSVAELVSQGSACDLTFLRKLHTLQLSDPLACRGNATGSGSRLVLRALKPFPPSVRRLLIRDVVLNENGGDILVYGLLSFLRKRRDIVFPNLEYIAIAGNFGEGPAWSEWKQKMKRASKKVRVEFTMMRCDAEELPSPHQPSVKKSVPSALLPFTAITNLGKRFMRSFGIIV